MMMKYGMQVGIMLLLAAMLAGCMASGTRNGDGAADPPGGESGTEAEANADGGVVLPAIKLPGTSESASMDMIGLIVYKGKIYTQSTSQIDHGHSLPLLGEKLGRTKAGIDEWSKQDDYAVEFASSIGETDVYAVKGYDPAFRIMTYAEHDGDIYTELYECLNGITVYTGEDVFGQLGLAGNVTNAQYRTHSDWNAGADHYQSIADLELVHSFVERLNVSEPVARDAAEAALGDYRDDEGYRELTLQLKDKTRVVLGIIRGGYIRYGYADVLFRMEAAEFEPLWEILTEGAQQGDNGTDEAAVITPQRALADMTQFMEMVKAKDAEGVYAFLQRSEFYSWFTLDMAALAIEGLERNFDLDSLHAVVDENSPSHSPDNLQFGFVLADRNLDPANMDSYRQDDHVRMVTLRYEQESGQPVVHTPYVRYYPFAEEMVRTYMRLIAEKQAAELARFMNADDLEVPLEVAEDTISAYHKALDMGSCSIHNDSGFTYTISDAAGGSHTVEVIYGDGLMGIRDAYTPEFSG